MGCFKVRDNADNRLRLRTHRWYDPHHELFDGDGSRYAEGPFYVIEGHLIDGIVRSGLTLRMGGPNEGEVLYTYLLARHFMPNRDTSIEVARRKTGNDRARQVYCCYVSTIHHKGTLFVSQI